MYDEHPRGALYAVTGAKVGDPDLPTYEQVRAWMEAQPVCLDGVFNCVRKHTKPGTREHMVVEACYFPDDNGGVDA